MALTVEPRRDRRTGFGGGLQTGIDLLIQNKLQSVEQDRQRGQTATGLQALGFSPEESQQLSMLPSQAISEIVKNKAQEPQRQAFISGLESLSGDPQSEIPAEGFDEKEGVADDQEVDKLGSAIRMMNKKDALEYTKIKLMKQQVAQKQKTEFRKESIAKQEKIDTGTKEYFKDVTKEAKTAKDANKKLDRLEQIARFGKLGSPIVNTMVKALSKGIFGVGLDLGGVLMTPDSEEFEKLSTDFVKGAKAIFGARLTDADLKAFFKTIPTLTQSREGMMRVITNLRRSNDAAILRKKMMTEITRDNNGRRPRNIDALVDERVDPILDRWAKEFMEAKPVTFEESGIIYNTAKLFGLAY